MSRQLPQSYLTGDAQRAIEGPTALEWEAKKEIIRNLYEKKRLKEVRAILDREHGFKATERMFKSRLSLWGINKNSCDHSYQLCAILLHQRKGMGKHSTSFLINGTTERSTKDLRKYVKGRKLSDDAFLKLALSKTSIDDALSNDSVRAVTPDPDAEVSEEGELPAKLSPDSDLAESGSSDESPKQGRFSPNKPGVSPVFSSRAVKQESFDIPGRFPPSTSNSLHERKYVPPGGTDHGAFQGHFQPSVVSWSQSPSSPPTVHTSSQAHHHHHRYAQESSETKGQRQRWTSCRHFNQQDFDLIAHQTIHPKPLLSIHGQENLMSWRALSSSPPSSISSDDFVKVCPTCGQDQSVHFHSVYCADSSPIPHTTSPRNIFNPADDATMALDIDTLSIPEPAKDRDAPWQFVSACYVACWNRTIHKRNPGNTRAKEIGDFALKDSERHFEAMLRGDDPAIIMTLNQILLVLSMHDQDGISQEIMQSAADVAQRVLAPTNPLILFVRFLVLAAVPERLPGQTEINSNTICGIWSHYKSQYGEEDVRSIATMYTYGYIMNVEADHERDTGKLEMSENILRRCYELSCRTLQHGAHHLQAIQALSNLHINLQRQRREPEAIHILRQAISDSRLCLGKMHPKRLALKMNAAEMLVEQGPQHEAEAERYFWDVLEGRIKMLGREHRYTKDIEWVIKDFLERRGRWYVGSHDRNRFYDLWDWNEVEIFEYGTTGDEVAPPGAF